MGFFGWVLLFIGLAIVWAIISAAADSSKTSAQQKALVTLPNFNPSVSFNGMLGGAGLAIDTAGQKLAISNGPHDTKVFGFSDLIGVEVLRNGSSVQKTNRGSQVAGAAVGAVLLGPVGLLLGGLTGSRRSIEKIDRLSLKVFTNDLVTPVHEIVFFKGPPAKPDAFVVKVAGEELDKWHGRLQTILHMSNRTAV